jgi:heme-degrading monooxygenase HmoA
VIIRVYHAQVYPGKEAEFERLVTADAVPLMQRQPGLLALHIGREWHGSPEFVMVSVWRDLDALKAFTGEHWQDPVVLHRDAEVLEKTWVEHFRDLEI